MKWLAWIMAMIGLAILAWSYWPTLETRSESQNTTELQDTNAEITSLRRQIQALQTENEGLRGELRESSQLQRTQAETPGTSILDQSTVSSSKSSMENPQLLGRLQGLLLTSRGDPLGGIRMVVSRSTGTISHYSYEQSAENGSFELALSAGSYQLEFENPLGFGGRVAEWFPNQTVEIEEGRSTNLTFRALGNLIEIPFHLQDSLQLGAGVLHAVYLKRLGAVSDRDESTHHLVGVRGERFQFLGIPDGNYDLLLVSQLINPDELRWPVVVANGIANVGSISLTKRPQIQICFVDAQGKPVRLAGWNSLVCLSSEAAESPWDCRPSDNYPENCTTMLLQEGEFEMNFWLGEDGGQKEIKKRFHVQRTGNQDFVFTESL